MDKSNFVGGSWLQARYGINLVMPLTVLSRIGGRRTTQEVGGVKTETFVEGMRPDSDLRGHLTFHLKHEVLHLELLARLFEKIEVAELGDWIEHEPNGQYARRAGFLYEWLTGSELKIQVEVGGGYVEVIDGQKLVAAAEGRSLPIRKWRIRDNLPGTPHFCPIVRKTNDVVLAMALDIQGLLGDLNSEFGEDVLMRSAVWMTLRESRSSFAIEGEADQIDRIQRFADVLARRTGQGSLPLSQTVLAKLQSEILGPMTTLQQMGIRQSPVFVGEAIRYQEVVHYVAPPSEDLELMLEGLMTFLDRTQGQSSVMRSAVAAFGFIYIHPLADGNGRVHRFLINDVLRRDKAIDDPMILPVSSLIDRDPSERRAYDRILDVISRPLMAELSGRYIFEPTQTIYPDGIASNFNFCGNEMGRSCWRYLDLTSHVLYLADILKRTICEDMQEESRYLRSHAQARRAIKDVLEMPDTQIDRVIRSALVNQGQLSGVLTKEIPLLATPGAWDNIIRAIESAFDGSSINNEVRAK